MLYVKTKRGPSGIQGMGLFARQFIPKGTLVWKYQPGFDVMVDPAGVSALSQEGRAQFLKYAYRNLKTGKYILCFDDARFFNHYDSSNCIDAESADDDEGIDIAARDIAIGEELTCNYREFDGDFEEKMRMP